MPYSSVYRRFGQTYDLHLQGRRMSQTNKKLLGGYFLVLFFVPEDSNSTSLRKVCKLIPDYTTSLRIIIAFKS
jgi:hypothetical protein